MKTKTLSREQEAYKNNQDPYEKRITIRGTESDLRRHYFRELLSRLFKNPKR